MDIDTALKFESRYTVDRSSGCWLWTGAHNKDGYGTAHIGPQTHLAHRLAYLLYVSDIGGGICVLHKCDNPGCVNPAHLFAGTHTDNMRDMQTKGRGKRPTHRPAAKLNVAKVAEIRALRLTGLTGRELAKRFGVSEPAISHILTGKTW